MTILCAVTTPTGSVIELHYESRKYRTVSRVIESEVEVSAEDAAEWYETARQLGGVMYRPLPERGAG